MLALLVAVSMVLSLSAVAVPFTLGLLVSEGISGSRPDRIVWYGLTLALFGLISAILSWSHSLLSATIGETVAMDLKVRGFESVVLAPYEVASALESGRVVQRLGLESDRVGQVLSAFLSSGVSEIFLALAALVSMFVIDPQLAFWAIGGAPLILVAARWSVRALEGASRKMFEAIDRSAQLVTEFTGPQGALLVRAFDKSEYVMDRHNIQAQAVRAAGLRAASVGAAFRAFYTFFVGLIVAVIFVVGGWMVVNDALTLGDLIAFSGFVGIWCVPFMSLASLRGEWAQLSVSISRIGDVRDLKRENGTLRDESAGADGEFVVSVSDLGFRYGGGVERVPESLLPDGGLRASSDAAIDGVSFVVESGAAVAIVGKSGSGKTTLSLLLSGVLSPSSGHVRVSSDSRGNSSRDLLLVAQEPFVLNDSIRANLCLGDRFSTGALDRALYSVGLDGLVRGLDGGLDCMVGAGGFALSGGERQRLALARAIVREPRVLVLDEFSSHLDEATEALVLSRVRRILPNSVIFSVTHRRAVVDSCDLVLVLDEGRLVQFGELSTVSGSGTCFSEVFSVSGNASPRITSRDALFKYPLGEGA